MLLKDINEYNGIYLACGNTDLRKSVDGLANIVRHDFEMDLFGNYLFLFCNRARNRLKGLMWDRNGFCLYYKRLDGEGAKFRWPNETEAIRDIKVVQLKLLLDGFTVDPPKGFGDVTARDF
jgi:transposase